MTSALTSVQAFAQPVNDLGGRWMLDPEVLGPCRDAGYPNGYAYYMVGRGGVLGDVDADVVSSAFGFFAPSLVRTMWERGVVVEGARAAATRYGAACAAFGRSRLSGLDGAARLAELAGRLAGGVDAAGLALFAGWRAEPLPDDAEGRAYFLLHVLRELRGSVHLVGVIASGITPLDAVLAAGGAAAAERFGWQGPFTDVPTTAKQLAERLTDEMMARLCGAVLTDDELQELTGLVLAARAHLDAVV
jgi:hypothetical protein